MTEKPGLGIIGGTGVYEFDALKKIQRVEVETPFGKPSSPIIVGEINGVGVAFLARHGIGHIHTPSDVNYRANIYALKSLGVEKIVSISACGSLRDDFAPGDIVIPDQLLDFTKDRKRSFFESGLVAHVGTADPFCETLSRALFNVAQSSGAKVHFGGAFVTIEGPRFSTRAESNLFRSWGMSIVGMTTAPEAFLAREAEICYAAFAHVTDFDVWHQSEEPVTVEMIVRTLHHNASLAQKCILALVNSLPQDECTCNSALSGAITTSLAQVDPKIKEKLAILVSKYLP